ncbi:MAG: 50S ribosomal protein L11 methyltransferase [Anaerolineaceae bacterium]|nr:MAG: 50S ribosomal protein L11 methyltransferase [Anaerolineaceae bacterium]
MTVFTEISVVTDGEAAEAVADVLRPFAYQDGVVLEQLGDPNNPDPLAVEPEVTVKIYIPQEHDTPDLRRRLEEILYHMNRLYPMPAPKYQTLEETDWATAWKEHYHPFRVGKRILIRPSWFDAEADAETTTESAGTDDVVLLLDPGMAFGTGLHPTTQKCLRALEQIVQPGQQVLDVGTGSGILAIAAVKLGAANVLGVDIDELAVKTAVANAEQNQVSDQVVIWQGDLSSVPARQWDVVLVNILAPVIIGLLDNGGLMNYVAESGWLVLSGIIESQADDVEHAVAEAGGRVVETLSVRDWVTMKVRPV